MDIFSEIYGCYYEVVAETLRTAPLSRKQVETLVAKYGYGESTLQLIPKLLDQNVWSLLEERDGLLYSQLEHTPMLPITTLERAWLKALLDDPRIRLFLTDAQLQHLSHALADVEPLYRQADFVYFDRYLDGDDYTNQAYRHRFQTLLNAIRNRTVLSLDYAPPKNRMHISCHLPLRLEYSAKDDKFRVYTIKLKNGAARGYHILNVNRILNVTPCNMPYDQPVNLENWRRRNRCQEPLLIRVINERSGIDRFMVEFSSYEKQSEYHDSTHTCTVKLWYQKDDETEVLIRLLGFGPVVQVLGPSRFVAQMRERVQQQASLLK